MGKVIFSISYDILPEKREEFLPLSKSMKEYIHGKNGVSDYSVYEVRGKRNSFTEVFIFGSMEDYNSLDDEDETMRKFVNLLEPMLAGGKMKYTTLIEIDPPATTSDAHSG